MTSGRFDTTTKTKIKTPHGTVLKVARYDYDFLQPDIEYKIRGVCRQCGKPTECFCYDESEFSNAFESAIEGLRFGFLCDNPQCVIRCEMETNPERVDELIDKYGEDINAICDAIYESWGEWDEAPMECGC